MRAAHDSDPEEDCSVNPTVTSDVPYVLLGDEKLEVQLCLLVVVGIDGAAAVTSLALGSLDGGTCGVNEKAEAGVVRKCIPMCHLV